MEGDQSRTFELEPVFLLEGNGDGLRVLGYHGTVVYICFYILINVPVPTHPDVGLFLAELESHIVETVRQSLVPTDSTGMEAIEHLEDHKRVIL